MTRGNEKILGIVFVIIGAALFISFAGRFLVEIIGAIISIMIINYGLKLQGLPAIWMLMMQWIHSFKFK
ncbi:hypothetical protein HOM50_01505 [bacterium]|jgi:hypothetical protein|nr:hypothetical protein [bacterium]MBT5015065.1 hypothetical protein [bacterium]